MDPESPFLSRLDTSPEGDLVDNSVVRERGRVRECALVYTGPLTGLLVVVTSWAVVLTDRAGSSTFCVTHERSKVCAFGPRVPR